MAHNRSPGKIRSDVLMSPLGAFSAWLVEVDCGGTCPRGRVYRVEAPAKAHGDRTVGDVVRRFRCTQCGAGPVTVTLSESFERRRVALLGPEVHY
jgi:hypothetical protein